MNGRLWFSERNESAVATALQDLGFAVEPYGQGTLNEAARAMLRRINTPERWRADFLVSAEQCGTVLVDAKYSGNRTANKSIEMRALVTAWGVPGLDTYYVHAVKVSGAQFDDFSVISAQDVRVHLAVLGQCCPVDKWTLTHAADPMTELPERCARQQRSTRASATPYILIPPHRMRPLTLEAFHSVADSRQDA